MHSRPTPRAVTAPEAIRVALEHHQAGRLRDAESIYRRVLEAKPDHPDALHLLGLIAHQSGNHELAVDLIGQAIRLVPSNADFLNHLGEAHRALGRPEEAEANYRSALSLDPGHALAHNNLALALNDLGRLDAAERHYRKALELDPDFDRARLNHALLKLLRGDYAGGFELFEARFEGGDDKAIGADRALLKKLEVPRWRGEPIPQSTLLLWTEQGLGDSLMMMRYIPLLKQRGVERVLVYCHHPLVRVMQTYDGVDEVILRDDPLPHGEFHCHCPLMSLPLLFGTEVDTIPAEMPYLRVPGWLQRRWAGEFAAVGRPRVGLTWASGTYTRTNQAKSMNFASLAPLLRVGGVTFVNLQKGEHATQREGLGGGGVLDWMNDCEDLLDTAALIEQLDLVVSVDTAVAHLAGALGKPVWLLSHVGSDWRWMVEGEMTPWYPTVRIFRQSRRGEWDDVVERAALALSARRDVQPPGTVAPAQRDTLPHHASIWERWLSRLRK